MAGRPHPVIISLIVLFLLCCAGSFAACSGNTGAGAVVLSFQWTDPPDQPLFLWVEVQEREILSETGSVLGAAQPAEFVPGEPFSLQVPQIPNGDNRVVVVEARSTLNTNAPVRFYGISEPFSVRAGTTTIVEVPLTLTRPRVEIKAIDEPLRLGIDKSIISPLEASSIPVVTRSSGAVEVELSNDPGFTQAVGSFSLSDGSKVACKETSLPELVSPFTECTMMWNLIPEEDEQVLSGMYTVYGRFIDANGYPTQALSASVYVDADGPLPIAASSGLENPESPAPCDQPFILTIDFHEELAEPWSNFIPVLHLSDHEVPVFAPGIHAPGTLRYEWTTTFPCEPEGDNRSHTLTITTKDKYGNKSIDASVIDSSGEPFSIVVDPAPPTVSQLIVTTDPPLSNSQGIPVFKPGSQSSLQVTFVLSENDAMNLESLTTSLLMPVAATFVSNPCLESEAVTGEWNCKAVLESSDGYTDGIWPIQVQVRDKAGNPGRLKSGEEWPAVLVDSTSPRAVCSLLPPPPNSGGYAIGDTIELRITPLESLSPDGSVQPETEVVSGECNIDPQTLFSLEPGPGPHLSFTHTVQKGEGEYELLWSLSLTDIAGNTTAPGSNACMPSSVQSIAIDGRPPTVPEASLISPPSPDEYSWLGTGRNLTADFTIDGTDEPPSTVRIGGVITQCSPKAAGWTCQHMLSGMEDQGIATLEVIGADESGNAYNFAFSFPELIFDFTPPDAFCQVNFEVAKAADEVQLNTSFSELVEKDSLLLVSNPVIDFSGGLFADSQLLSQFAWTVPSGFPETVVNYQLYALDFADNPSDGSALCTGSFIADGEPIAVSKATAATLEYVNEAWQEKAGAAAWSVHPGDAVSLSLVLAAPPASSPSVTLGLQDLSNFLEETGPTSFSLHYIIPVPAQPSVSVNPLSALAVDVAGNETVISPGQPILIDSQKPTLVGTPVFSRCDDHGPAIVAVNDLWMTAGLPCTFNFEVSNSCMPDEESAGSLRLVFALSESIDIPSAAVTIAGHEATVDSCSSPNYITALYDPTGDEPQNQCVPVIADVQDLAGNKAQLVLGCVRFDFEAPEPALTSILDRIVYTRIPWGNTATNGQPAYAVAGQELAVEPHSRILVIDAIDDETASIIGVGSADSQGSFQHWEGLLPGINLDQSDRAVIYLIVEDRAGNRSDADGEASNGIQGGEVMDVEWIASPGGKVPGKNSANPHQFLSSTAWSGACVPHNGIESQDAGLLNSPETQIITTGDPIWRKRPWIATKPTARYSHALARSPDGKGLVMFGGKVFSGVRLDDTWKWDGFGWAEAALIDPEGDGSPLRRNGHAMALDPSRNRVVLFAGDSVFGLLDDTWEWDGLSWRERIPSDATADGSPSARSGHAMAAFDKDVHLFGGAKGSSVLADHWSWDGADWQSVIDVDPEADGYPEARAGHSLAATDQGLVLFGGCTQSDLSKCSVFLDDMWLFNGTSWLNIIPEDPEADGGPAGRSGAFLVSGGQDFSLYLFGGTGASGLVTDLWRWTGSSWLLLTPSGELNDGLIPARTRGGAAWCPVMDRLVIHGGVFGTVPRDDTWSWEAGDWSKLKGYDGDQLGDPPARHQHALAKPWNSDSVWLFGGNNYSVLEPNPEVFDDLWRYANGNWDFILTDDNLHDFDPQPRYDHAMTAAPDGGLLLSGGKDESNNLLQDTWWFHDNEWENLCKLESCAHLPVSGHSIAWDPGPARNVVVLFGGVTSGNLLNGSIWEWNGETWTDIIPADPELDGNPQPRDRHAMVWDGNSNTILIYGGMTSDGLSGDLWSWDGTHWQLLYDQDSFGPPPTSQASFVFDENRQRCLLFGGNTQDGLSDEMWEWDGTSWHFRPLFGEVAGEIPHPTKEHQGVFLADPGSMVTFGGSHGSVLSGDTWTWTRSNERPAHLFRVRFSDAGAGSDATIRQVRVDWTCGSDEMAELDDGSGSELQVWDLGTWLPIATAIPHTGSTDAPEPLTWTTSNPMRLTVGSDRLFVGDEQWFGAMTTSLKPVGPALGKHRSDDVAVSISYHRSPILHFGFSGPDHSGWTSTPDNWSTMDKASCLLSTTGHERFYDSPESVFSTSDEDILTMGYTALCGPLNLTLRWRIQYAPGIWGDFSTQTSIPIPVSADSKLHISSVPLNVSSWQSKNIRQLQLVTEGNGQDCGPGQILIHWMAVTGKKVE